MKVEKDVKIHEELTLEELAKKGITSGIPTNPPFNFKEDNYVFRGHGQMYMLGYQPKTNNFKVKNIMEAGKYYGI